MRLAEIRKILSLNAPKLAVGAGEAFNSPHGPAVHAEGKAALLATIVEIATIPALTKQALAILRIPAFNAPEQPWALHVPQLNQLRADLSSLQERAQDLLYCLELSTPEPQEFELAYRLPDGEDSVSKLIEDLGALKLAFEQPMLRLRKESVALEGFDVGSRWLRLTAASAKGLGLIVGLYVSAFAYGEIRERYDVERSHSVFRKLAEADQLAMVEMHKKLIDIYARDLAQALVDRDREPSINGSKDREESLTVTAKAISTLHSQIARGSTISLSERAPSEFVKTLETVEKIRARIPTHVKSVHELLATNPEVQHEPTAGDVDQVQAGTE